MDPNNFRHARGKSVGSSSIYSIYQRFELFENRLFTYADDSTLLAVLRKPADRAAVTACLKWDLDGIQEWGNHWCMILYPNKTEALVVSRSRSVSPPHGDLVLSGVSIRDSPNLDIISMKFDSKLTFEDHVRGIVSLVSQRIDILRLETRIYVDTSVLLRCYFAFVFSILEYCSPVWGSAAECHLQLIHAVWLGLKCRARLILTLITVCSACFHLLLLEFDILEL